MNSMTGFARCEKNGQHFQVTVEIKTVNNRFKEFRFRTPSILNSIELELKKVVSEYVRRGSVDVHISYKSLEEKEKTIKLNYPLINSYLKNLRENISEENQVTFSATDFIRSEFLEEVDKTELAQKLIPDVLLVFREACKELHKSRKEEGLKIKKQLLSYKDLYIAEFNKIKPFSDTYEDSIKTKLVGRLDEFMSSETQDRQRLQQEIIFYLEKLDINEELDRIKFHWEKFSDLMEHDQEVGRQVDFLLQELNRETNTIGSKSGHSEISSIVVQLKTYLEKIREQNLNLE